MMKNRDRIFIQIEQAFTLGRKVFKTDKDFLDWVWTKQKQFDDRTPFRMLEEGEGQVIIDLLKNGLGE
jgi:hypothetical protein